MVVGNDDKAMMEEKRADHVLTLNDHEKVEKEHKTIFTLGK